MTTTNALNNSIDLISELAFLVPIGLVLLAIPGIACLEAGLTRAKNANYAFMKALLVTATAFISFCLFNAKGFPVHTTQTLQGYFTLNAALVSWIAVVVASVLAERGKILGILIATGILAGPFYSHLIFPLIGYSTPVGSLNYPGQVSAPVFAGAISLAAVLALGPRLGKYNRDGSPNPLPGHNLPLAILGLFLVSIGWLGIGFSQIALMESHASGLMIQVTTNVLLSGLAGCLSTSIMVQWLWKKIDIALILCGTLAGLAASSQAAQVLPNDSAILIGAIAGVLAAGTSLVIERAGIDDVMGIFPAFGLGGIVGLLSWALFYNTLTSGAMASGFSRHEVWVHLGYALQNGILGFVLMGVIFLVLRRLGLLRVSPAEELQGLDLSIHGGSAYPQG